MKFLFTWNHLFKDDFDCKLGLDWYSFSPVKGCQKGLEGSGGFSVNVFLIWRWATITWVQDYAAYRARIDYRRSGPALRKRNK